jgi:hypothetical protein
VERDRQLSRDRDVVSAEHSWGEYAIAFLASRPIAVVAPSTTRRRYKTGNRGDFPSSHPTTRLSRETAVDAQAAMTAKRLIRATWALLATSMLLTRS